MVTIIKLNKAFKSIRLKLLFTYLFVGIIPLLIFVQALLDTVDSHYITQKTKEIQRRSNILSTELAQANMTDQLTNNNELNKEIDRLSKELNGRVLIVDKNPAVIKDTSQTEEGSIKLGEDVSRGLAGENFVKYFKDQKILQAISPIVNTQTQEVLGIVILSASTNEIITSVEDLRNKAVLLFVISTIIIIIVSYYYADILTRPFKALLNFIKKITEGHFDESVKVKGHLEIEEIATAFNQMTRRLQEIEQSRQEFVSNVSHELRTPLTSIKVLADSLLVQDQVPVELYKEFLNDINEEIDRESKIINDLLSLVKLDKKEAKLNIEQVNINELVKQIMKRLRPIAAKKDVEMVYESTREVVAEIDEVKLSLAINNLIENAIKYNNDHGWVKISLDADHKFFYMKVQDSGIGIPEDEQDKIFQRFYRVDKARSRETGGTGLGLAITRHAILMHKGFIKVLSKEGEGTTFTMRVPLHYIL